MEAVTARLSLIGRRFRYCGPVLEGHMENVGEHVFRKVQGATRSLGSVIYKNYCIDNDEIF